MEFIEVKKLKLCYFEINKELKNNVLFLHGWGTSGKIFLNIANTLDCHGIFLDLPGFGESEIIKPLSIDEYVDIIHEFINKLQLKDLVILGHSFGGRIAIKYASKYQIKGLYLVDSAGIKPKRKFIYYFKVYSYKLFKKLNIKLNFGSKDFNEANKVMKRTLVLAVNEDLKPYLEKIKCKTVIIWGVKDKETSYKDALIMHKLIKKSVVYPILDTGHFPFIEDPKSFILYFNLGGNYLCF